MCLILQVVGSNPCFRLLSFKNAFYSHALPNDCTSWGCHFSPCPESAQNWHISTHLAALHWLPIDSLIEYKLASLCYKLPQVYCSCLFDWAPEGLHTKPPATLFFWYFHCLSSICVCMHLLGQTSFSCAAPSIWNSLPFKVRLSSTPASFKSSFKSHLFKQSYWLCVCVCVCVLCFVMGYVLQSAEIVHKKYYY